MAFSTWSDAEAKISDDELKESAETVVQRRPNVLNGTGALLMTEAISYILMIPDDDPHAKYWLFGDTATLVPLMQPSS